MAKSNSGTSGIKTIFKDCITPIPSGASDWGGKLADQPQGSPGPTKGELASEVQVVTVAGTETEAPWAGKKG